MRKNKHHPRQMTLEQAQRMAQQVFISPTITTQINNFGEFNSTESRSENVTVRLTSSQKKIMQAIAGKEGTTISSLTSEFIEFAIEYIDCFDKLSRHADVVIPFISKLP